MSDALTGYSDCTFTPGKQLSERTTPFGDKLEIYFDSLAETMQFTVVLNNLTQYPCHSWREASDIYDHFYAGV